MRIQNITGTVKLFSLGRRAVTMSVNEIITVQDEKSVIDAVMGHAGAGRLRVLEGPRESQVLRSKVTTTTFAIRPGAFARWANGDHVNINGVKFEADNDATRVVAGSILFTLGGDLTAFETNLTAAVVANAAALAAVGVVYKGKKTVNSLVTLFFTLDTTVTAVGDAVVAFTNAGGSGVAPTVVAPSVVAANDTSVWTVDVVVPAGKTNVSVVAPYNQVLSAPEATQRTSVGVLAAAPTVYNDGPFIEITGLTAGNTVTIVAFCRD